jgi:hypothetical protein
MAEENNIDYLLKKAELDKKKKEIEVLGKNTKLEFYIKVLSIVSGILIGGIGIYSAYISHLQKNDLKTELEQEISQLKEDKNKYSSELDSKKIELEEIRFELDSVNNIIRSGGIAISKQQSEIANNLNRINQLKANVSKKTNELLELEKKYNARLEDIQNLIKKNEAIDTEKSSASIPSIKILPRTISQNSRVHRMAIQLEIDHVSENDIKSVSYTFAGGSGFQDVDQVDYKSDYVFKIRRDFEMIVILNLKNGKVYTKTQQFLFDEKYPIQN